jgi:glycosyltransferase involved in cell wall biosynthesis
MMAALMLLGLLLSNLQRNTNVKGVRFMRNFGKSQALHAGFAKAQGDVIITMDDLQDSPEEIPGLYNMITTQF